MADPHFMRACVLLEQGRADLAVDSFRQSLSVDPDNPETHALLAVSYQVNGQAKDAVHHAREALARDPDRPLPHYVLAQVHLEQHRTTAAWEAAEEAMRLDPDDPDYLALAASIRYHQSRFPEALQLAQQGLELDATHVGCNNLRAVTLRALGDHEGEDATLSASLHRNPENANTHANMGWSHLHRGKPHDAMFSFREALRLDPGNDWARSGIVEALKARNPVYKTLLGVLLKLSHLSPRTQWAIIIGAWLAVKVVREVQQSHPHLAPFLQPLIIAYFAFAFLSWTATSLFNVTLLTSSFGRFVLSTHEKTFAGLHLACLGLGGALAVTGLVIGSSAWVWAGLFAVLLMIPVGAAANARSTRAKAAIYGLVGGIVLLGVAALVRLGMGLDPDPFAGLYLISLILFTWVANLLLSWLQR